MRMWTCVTAAFAALVALAAPVAAAPVIQVRGRPGIELEPVRRVDGGIEIAGKVVELVGGDPLPFVVVEILLDGDPEFTQTDGDGYFHLERTLDDGSHHMVVSIDADEQLAEARVELERFDVERRPLSLSVSARQPDSTAVRVSVQATGDLPTGDLAIEVRAGSIDGPTQPVGTVRTDPRGEGEMSIPMTSLGGPGQKLVEVHFAGDAVWDAASGHTVTTLESATTIALALEHDVVRHEGRLVARGRLFDREGNGLGGLPIALRGKNRVLADAITDADGGFGFSIAASEIGPGALTVQASFDPQRGWLGASRSPILGATIEARRPVPLGLTLGALAATAAALCAFVALRTRPWERWAWTKPAVPPADAEAPSATTHEGLAPARPSLRNTLRRPGDVGFAGCVVSRPVGKPLPGATIVVELAGAAGETRETVCGDDGRFAFEDLPAGRHTARASARGHVTVRFPILVPHRGELRDARVDLVEVRERMFAGYRIVAEPLLPEAGGWGLFTPRQIVDAVRAQRPAPALASLTDYIEEKYFSGRSPDEAELAEAGKRIDDAREEHRP